MVIAALLALPACRASAPPARVASAPLLPAVAAAPPPPAPAPIDSDGDGKPDEADFCPDRAAPQAPGYDDGCPHGRGIQRAGMALQIMDWIPFSSGSARVDPDTQTRIDGFADWMMEVTPKMTLVEVLGHATADERNDRKLARIRAETVREALIKRGVPPERLTTRGKAESEGWKPMHGFSDDPRISEYRVEFRLLKNAVGAMDPEGVYFHLKVPCVTDQPISDEIDFLPGQREPTPAGAAAIDAAAAFLKAHPEAGVATVATFDGGPVSYTRVPDPLAYARVTLVRDQLVARGVPAARLARVLPRSMPPGARRRVSIHAMLPNPHQDPIAPGCLDSL